MILEFMPYQACCPILKLVYSATTNANHNMCSNEAISIISKVEVNKGKHCEKIKTSSSVMGQGYQIKRPTYHITIILKDLNIEKAYLYEYYKYNIKY